MAKRASPLLFSLPAALRLGALCSVVLLLAACQNRPAGPPAARAVPEVGVVTVTAQDAPLELSCPGA
jgi:membrane fusion protein (multidrug efflux system)